MLNFRLNLLYLSFITASCSWVAVVACTDVDAGGNDNSISSDHDDSGNTDMFLPDTDTNTPPRASGFLKVVGNRLVDDTGAEARLTGVNWFGFETSNLSRRGFRNPVG